jgi:hypothetical protein
MPRRGDVRVDLLLLLLGVVLWWVSTGPSVEACRSSKAVQSRNALIQSLTSTVSQTLLYDTIRDLQDDDTYPGWDALRSRYTFSPELAVERDYIRVRMEQAGLTVQKQTFAFKGTTQTNLEGTLLGEGPGEDTVYILCAHYDSMSEDPYHVAPGADDNASGVAGMLEAARILGQYRFRHTLRFVAFAAEEQDMAGSGEYAEAARIAGTKIGGVINLDMIAWNGNGSDVMEIYAHPSDSQTLGKALSDTISMYHIALNPRYDIEQVPAYADHYSFWVRHAPAILVTDDTSNPSPDYHTSGDTLSTLDMVYAHKFVQAVVATLAEQAEIIPPGLGVAPTDPTIARRTRK